MNIFYFVNTYTLMSINVILMDIRKNMISTSASQLSDVCSNVTLSESCSLNIIFQIPRSLHSLSFSLASFFSSYHLSSPYILYTKYTYVSYTWDARMFFVYFSLLGCELYRGRELVLFLLDYHLPWT
jgi:hypothetical protein